MGKMWAPRWEEKAARLRLVSGDDWRQDPQLMHGIQSIFDKRDVDRWAQRCKAEQVPWEFWGDSIVGRPQVMDVHGQLVNPGSLRHAYTAHRIKARYRIHDQLGRVVEIGGGYGGFARALHQRIAIGHYVLVDHPACLAIQKRFLRDAVLHGHFAFVEPDQLDQFDDVDLIVNHNSFGEMDPPEVEAYFGAIHRIAKAGAGLHIVNRILRQTSLSQYPLDDRWELEVNPWMDDNAWFELWGWRTLKGPGLPRGVLRSR